VLRRGDQVPHFSVTTLDGKQVVYRNMWQRRNLLLALCARCDAHSDLDWVAQLGRTVPELAALNTEYVITAERIAGFPASGVVIADRWGEIQAIVDDPDGAVVDADDILDWLRYVENRCPECEGESR
jgi:hypothetical protein